MDFRIATDLWHRAGNPVKNELRQIKEAGFDGVEFTFSEEGERNPPLSDRGYLRLERLKEDASELRRAASEVGLEVPSVRSGLLWRYPLTSPDPKVREKALEIVERELEACSLLGAEVLLVVPGLVTEDVTYDEAYRVSQSSLKVLARKAEEVGVTIGVENVCNNFLLSPMEMARFIDELGSERIGAYLDVGNVLACRQGFPQHWVQILGKRVKRVHVKDYDTRSGTVTYPPQGDVNWPSVIRALRGTGYRGYLTAELPPFKFLPEMSFKYVAEIMRALIYLPG